MIGRILIIDDEAGIRSSLSGLLEDEGYAVDTAPSGEEGLAAADRTPPDVILLDLILGGIDVLEVLARFKERTSQSPLIMMSGQATLEAAIQATRLGALTFLEKPLDPGRVLAEVATGMEIARLRRENEELRSRGGESARMVGESPVMRRLREQIRKVAPTNATVLILGQSGTGKELVARAIHSFSGRSEKPFVQVNCAAIPRELIESELFGYERGAFTGATNRHRGRFEQADGGSIFLDEVADTGPEAQARMLRVLQEGEVQRLGSEEIFHVDVRVIAATNRDLARLIAEGEFREDLFYRLNVMPLEVPPLVDRSEDIPVLAEEFMASFARRNDRLPIDLPPAAMHVLREADWPGNVRQLRNAIERLMILHEGREVSPDDVREVISGASPRETLPQEDGRSLRELLEEYEERILRRELEASSGVVSRVAERLNTDRANLYRKLKRYGLK